MWSTNFIHMIYGIVILILACSHSANALNDGKRRRAETFRVQVVLLLCVVKRVFERPRVSDVMISFPVEALRVEVGD